MKKILKCFFAVMMVSLLALFIPFGNGRVANADDIPTVKKELKLEVELIENDKADEFSFRIKINENPGIHSLKFELGYDSSKMMMASYTGSQVLEDKLKLVTPVTERKEEGYAYMPFVFDYQSSGNENDDSTGAILLIRFKLKEGIENGDHKVSFINTKATYYDTKMKNVEEYDVKIDALKLHVLDGGVQSIELYDGIDPILTSNKVWLILILTAGGLAVILVGALIIVKIRKLKNRPKKVNGVYRSVKTTKKARNSRIKKK